MKKTNKQTTYIAYYRVSTQKQSLGLDAQKNAVKSHLKALYPPSFEYTEKESGKKANRPELNKALNKCKELNATLIVAKLDRLSRDLFFITKLQKAKINFLCCDMPHATPLTIHIFGAIAEDERKTISKRTSEALQALKRKGKKLGSNNPKVKKGLEKRWDKQRKKTAKKLNLIKQEQLRKKKLREKGIVQSKSPALDNWIKTSQAVRSIKSYDKKGYSAYEIAEKLTEASTPTRRGKAVWYARHVYRILKRLNSA